MSISPADSIPGSPFLLDRATARYVAAGACLLAAGGGGSLQLALKLVDEVFTSGVATRVVGIDMLGARQWIATTAEIGSPARLFDAPSVRSRSATNAIGVLEKRCRALRATGDPRYADFDRFVACAPIEVGAVNSLVAVVASMDRGTDCLDVDGAGRAVPTLPLSLFAKRLPPTPNVLAGGSAPGAPFVDSMQGVDDEAQLEAAALGLIGSGALGDQVGLALYAGAGDTMRSADPVTGSIGHSLTLGSILADGSGADRVGRVLHYVNTRMGRHAAIAYTGRVTEMVQATAGLDVGHVIVQGDGAFTGSRLWITIQNENILAQRDDQTGPLVMAPDSLCYLTDQGDVFDNSDLYRLVTAPHYTPVRVNLLAIEAPQQVLGRPTLTAAWADVRASFGYPGPFSQPWLMRAGDSVGVADTSA